MIGVIACPADESAVREFFELFKIPWEFFRADRQYNVVICSGRAELDEIKTRLILVYSGEKVAFDGKRNTPIRQSLSRPTLSFRGSRLPIYGSALTFRRQNAHTPIHENSGDAIAYLDSWGETKIVRIGYDLFREIRALLLQGQPPENAGFPTLEQHISLLRDLITGCGIPLVEIPPVPDKYPFIACLTHDVDHASIRRHKFDHTMFGFLYRATLRSAVDYIRGRLSLGNLYSNWSAAAKLPFVYLGLGRDFWSDFDRYLAMEGGRPSTFFIIPFAGSPGRSKDGLAPRARASAYGPADITEKVARLVSAGCEIGLHGIDAWLESSSGREEAQQVSKISRRPEGVRMHWLYQDEKSPKALEEAGFSYDSTVGYNETVGYRAGTSQVFKPLQAERLLELPMHVMDTALFYPSYLNLSQDDARERILPFCENAARHGGVITVNWHDRSIAPERLWGDFYTSLVEELSMRGAWFSTAGEAVAWFRKRRSAVFEEVVCEGGRFQVKVTAVEAESLPGLRLRFHRPWTFLEPAVALMKDHEDYVDMGFDGHIDADFRMDHHFEPDQAS